MRTGSTLRVVVALAACATAASAARAHTNVNAAGSAYVDYWYVPRSIGTTALQSVTPEGSLKIAVDVHDELSFSAKTCFGCHGIEMEHLQVEYTPRSWFNVQAGRIALPFGEFSNRVDPFSHKTASAPLIFDMGRMALYGRNDMNLGVVPAPFVDTGVLVFGQAWIGERLQVWYGAYGVAGLRGSNDFDFVSQRTAYYSDNNRTPAGGGRIALTWSQANSGGVLGDVSVGGSFTAGRYDVGGALGYAAWGVDANTRVGPVVIRGEYATRRTDLDPTAPGYAYQPVDSWFRKSGWYAELEHPLGSHLAAVYRADALRREGAPLPGSDLSPDAKMTRYSAGLMVTPTNAFFVKLGYEYWQLRGFAAEVPTSFHSFHGGVGGSF